MEYYYMPCILSSTIQYIDKYRFLYSEPLLVRFSSGFLPHAWFLLFTCPATLGLWSLGLYGIEVIAMQIRQILLVYVNHCIMAVYTDSLVTNYIATMAA